MAKKGARQDCSFLFTIIPRYLLEECMFPVLANFDYAALEVLAFLQMEIY
jgi:hypothetical protein